MKYQIEKGVPLANVTGPHGQTGPRSPAGRTAACVPLADMEAGDSVLIPAHAEGHKEQVRTLLTYHAKKLGIRIKTRTCEQSKGLRVWRTE